MSAAVKEIIKSRLKNALWQLGRELATDGAGLPDGSYQVAIKDGVVRVFEQAELVGQASNKLPRFEPKKPDPTLVELAPAEND